MYKRYQPKINTIIYIVNYDFYDKLVCLYLMCIINYYALKHLEPGSPFHLGIVFKLKFLKTYANLSKHMCANSKSVQKILSYIRCKLLFLYDTLVCLNLIYISTLVLQHQHNFTTIISTKTS